MFSISGSDIVIRQTEIPVMDEENIRDTVTWEMNQYLPQEGQDHYIDFEILEKNAGSEQKTYKVLVVAAPKEKIESYLELSQRLNLKLRAIDVSANCVARIFKTKVNNISNESLGVINIGSKNSNIILVENGKLFMEREVPFGTENVIREISRRLDMSQEEAEHYLYNIFSFKNINEEDEIQKRIQTLFDNVFSTFQKVIQFYSNGKVKKNLDGIYFSNVNNAIDGLIGAISCPFIIA
jgi:type IV pilus assembly protein PilM